MANVVNVAISDTFVLRDNTNAAITGKVSADFATVEAYQISAPGTTAAVTLAEIGAGEYRISFTPTTPTTGSDLVWTSHVVYNSGGVFREFSETYTVIAVASTVTVVSTATSGALTQTLAQLRKRVAARLGDYDALTATSNGANNTFIDVLYVNTASENMKGRFLVLSDGTVHRVTGFNDSTNTLTFTPVAASTSYTATNSIAELYNKRGAGGTPAEYKDAINNAINDAFPIGLIAVRSTIGTVFDADTPEVTVPAAMTHVHTVEWQDDDSFWHEIPRSNRASEYGWIADPTAGQIRILGGPADDADSNTIRLTGYGRQDTLSVDADTCALNGEFIVSRACYHLCYAWLDKDQKFRDAATTYEREALRLRSRLRTPMNPGTVRVRAA